MSVDADLGWECREVIAAGSFGPLSAGMNVPISQVMNDGVTVEVSERSDVDAFRVVARETMVRALGFVGVDTDGATTRTIEAVRILADRGYTAGDLQVDQQLIAGANADDRIAEKLSLVDVWDRAVVLRHVTRLVAGMAEITVEAADFLEQIGALLEMPPTDIEYVVISELSGER